MQPTQNDEWGVIERLLPAGWKKAAREKKAFQRARYITDPAPLLRLLLFHAVNDAGLRETVAQARASGIAEMSQVALLKRLRSSCPWLAWVGAELCRNLREEPRLPAGLRPRAVDSTTIQGGLLMIIKERGIVDRAHWEGVGIARRCPRPGGRARHGRPPSFDDRPWDARPPGRHLP